MTSLASLFFLLSNLLISRVLSQEDNLGLSNGYITLSTANFNLQLVRNAHVLASLQPATSSFDFLPFDYLSKRARNGQYHWGDITFRYRRSGATTWINGDSAAARQPVTSVPASGGDSGSGSGPGPGVLLLASSRLGPTLPAGPLNITREWLDISGDLGLRFTIQNSASGGTAVEIGSLGFPAEFNSIFTGRTAADMQRLCSLSEPYIGMHAGQIRVAPIRSGTSAAALVVTPLGDTPLEAYRNLREPSYPDTAYGSQTFEGFYEWQTLTKAWAENEWNSSSQATPPSPPWNPPSSKTLQPGQSLQFGVRFSLVHAGVRALDAAVRRTSTPTAVGVPGYIIPRGEPAQLFLSQSPSEIKSITSEPADALVMAPVSSPPLAAAAGSKYTVQPSASAWGRVRLTVTYGDDNKTQTIHYYVTKRSTEAVADLGRFLTTRQWFNDTSDPFGRAPSVMTYDYETQSIVTQDARVWVAGLSDEAGAGSYLTAFMKQAIQPNADEVAKLEQFVDTVLWNTQTTTGIQTPGDFAVRKSLFFYDPAATELPSG